MNQCKVCSKPSDPLVCAHCVLTDFVRGRAARAVMLHGPRAAIVIDAQTVLTLLGPKPEAMGSGERVVVDEVDKPHEIVEMIDLSTVPNRGPKS